VLLFNSLIKNGVVYGDELVICGENKCLAVMFSMWYDSYVAFKLLRKSLQCCCWHEVEFIQFVHEAVSITLSGWPLAWKTKERPEKLDNLSVDGLISFAV